MDHPIREDMWTNLINERNEVIRRFALSVWGKKGARGTPKRDGDDEEKGTGSESESESGNGNGRTTTETVISTYTKKCRSHWIH